MPDDNVPDARKNQQAIAVNVIKVITLDERIGDAEKILRIRNVLETARRYGI